MIKCPECKGEIYSNKWIICPHCGCDSVRKLKNCYSGKEHETDWLKAQGES